MIMATIMMIGMALMALKMKIACSRFAPTVCPAAVVLLLLRLRLPACSLRVFGHKRRLISGVMPPNYTLSAFDFITLICMRVVLGCVCVSRGCKDLPGCCLRATG